MTRGYRGAKEFDPAAARDALIRKMTSGVQEIEQPQLGRTSYRSFDELQRALALVNGLSGAGGGSVTVIQSVRSSSCGSGCGCPTAWDRWGSIC